MNRFLEKAYRGVTGYLPPNLASQLDLMRPSYGHSWGGPLNGQARRRDIVRDLAKVIKFNRVIETGTYRGTSTEFFSAVFGAPVETVEANPRFFAYCSRRLRSLPDVKVKLGDSRAFLRELAEEPSARTEAVFIYLDAHWKEDLPLAEELTIIGSAWTKAVVMIDDFQVPGDVGYKFDDYGGGKALIEAYLPAGALSGWKLCYPAAHSEHESGEKRGSCVLVSPVLRAVGEVPTLRAARVLQ